MRGPALVLALALAACGGDSSKGVAVSEAPDVAARGPLRPSAFDTTYDDGGLFVDPSLRPDSLRADSLRRDSVRTDSLRRAAAGPDFRAFFPTFRAAAEAGDLGPLAMPAVRDDAARALAAPFGPGVRALTARDFRRDGTAREATVVVGFDAEGRVVPQDEALTERTLTLRFDVVEGGYRLVAVEG